MTYFAGRRSIDPGQPLNIERLTAHAARWCDIAFSANLAPDAPRAFETISAMPTESGVIFGINRGGHFVILRPPDLPCSDEVRRLLAAAPEATGLGERLYQGERWMVTCRDARRVCRDTPPVVQVLESARGKVVFVGNGLSTLPLALSAPPSRACEVWAVDMIDVRALRRDLVNLNDRLMGAGLSNPYRRELAQAEELIGAADRGEVNLCQHYFGAGLPPPSAITDAAVVVAYEGASAATATEQAELLAPSASLYYFPFTALINIDESRFDLEPVEQRVGMQATISAGWRVFRKESRS